MIKFQNQRSNERFPQDRSIQKRVTDILAFYFKKTFFLKEKQGHLRDQKDMGNARKLFNGLSFLRGEQQFKNIEPSILFPLK